MQDYSLFYLFIYIYIHTYIMYLYIYYMYIYIYYIYTYIYIWLVTMVTNHFGFVGCFPQVWKSAPLVNMT